MRKITVREDLKAKLVRDFLHDVGKMELIKEFIEEEMEMNREHIVQTEQLKGAMQEFVDRCEKGEVRSTYTYNKFKELLK